LWTPPFLDTQPGAFPESLFLNRRLHGFVDSDHPEEPVFDDEQVEQDGITLPSNGAHDSTGNRVENEVIRCTHDRNEDRGRVSKAECQAKEPSRAGEPNLWCEIGV